MNPSNAQYVFEIVQNMNPNSRRKGAVDVTNRAPPNDSITIIHLNTYAIVVITLGLEQQMTILLIVLLPNMPIK
jgi:hypothetical protein